MADVEREWVIPNGFVTGAGDPVSREEAIRLLSKRLLLPGPLDGSNPISDLIDIIPRQLWTESALTTIDITPFVAALKEATTGGAGTVNGVRVGGGHEGTKFSVESYAEGLDMISGKEAGADALKSAILAKFPNISEADQAAVAAEVRAALDSDTTARSKMATVEDFMPVVASVVGDRQYGGATVVNAEGETTATPTTPGPSTSWEQTRGQIDLNGTGGTGMSEADMRNAYATDDLTWGQIREAWSAGTSRPTLTFGIDSSMGFDDPTGDPRVGFNRAARRVGLLDAVEQVKYITDVERRVLQQRMEAAGYFRDAYRPGVNDAATKDAWTQVVSDAWYENKQVTQVLAERAAAVEQAKREALEKAKQAAVGTDQLSIDDGRFRFLANDMATKVLGRELTDAEMSTLRADMLAYDQQRTTTTLDRSFESGGQLQTPAPLSEAEINANSADWMRENRADEATWVESYSRLFTVMDTLGIETKMPNLSTEEMQMYGAQAAANKWTPDRMFLQILVNAMDGASA